MDCIYLNCDGETCYCHAQPIREKEAVIWCKPSSDDLKDFCKDAAKWHTCNRFHYFGQYAENVQKR